MIRAENVSKCYTIYNRSMDRLRDWIMPWSARRGREFWALRDVDLEVAAGTSLGVVGVNGAGKSTLLKILTGTTVPTSGRFQVEGRVSALLELGMGFHPEFTGRENINFNGKMLGLTDEELREKTPQIIDFSEIASFIDQPLRTYSSGMGLRLAFAVASSVDPDVLIIDEALSVGDLHFQQKCLARIRQFHERGVTVLFVSHDPALVKSFCNEAILLDDGRIIDRGKPDQVLDYYNALLAEKYRDEGSKAQIFRPAAPEPAPDQEPSGEESSSGGETPRGSIPTHGHRTGNFQMTITRVEIEAMGRAGNKKLLTPGMEAKIRVRAVAFVQVENPTVGILIKDRLGNEVYGTNTEVRSHRTGTIQPGSALDVEFIAPMNLGEGLYSITAAVHQGSAHTEVCYDWIERAEVFQVLPNPMDQFIGVCRLDVKINHGTSPARPEELEAQPIQS